jgi:hypothetical protein
MMKKRTFRFLLLCLPALVWPAAFFAHTVDPVPTVETGQSVCVAPAPGWLTAVGVTPNSVSLAWEPNAYTTYYRVEGLDVGLGQAVPTNVVNTPSITVNNLLPGHTYQFTVSASYCPEGDWSEGIMVEIQTGIIVIDAIVEFQNPCNQFNMITMNGGQSFNFCVRETFSANSPYPTGMLGKINYADKDYWFGLAVSNGNGRIGPNPLNQNQWIGNYFHFEPSNLGPGQQGAGYAQCVYTEGNTMGNGTPLFTVDYQNSTNVGYVDFSITFHESMDFRMCNTCSPPERSDESTDSPASDLASAPSDITLLLPPSPNPFSESATLHYERLKPGPTQLNLYDAMGRLVQAVSNEAHQDQGEYSATISGEGLPDGVYYLHMVTGEGKKVFPLIKRQ